MSLLSPGHRAIRIKKAPFGVVEVLREPLLRRRERETVRNSRFHHSRLFAADRRLYRTHLLDRPTAKEKPVKTYYRQLPTTSRRENGIIPDLSGLQDRFANQYRVTIESLNEKGVRP